MKTAGNLMLKTSLQSLQEIDANEMYLHFRYGTTSSKNVLFSSSSNRVFRRYLDLLLFVPFFTCNYLSFFTYLCFELNYFAY